MQDWLINSFTAKQHTSRITRYGLTRLPHFVKHIRPYTSLEGVRLNAWLTHRLVQCQATHNPNHRAWSHLAASHYQAYQSPTLPLKEWGWTQEGVIVHCQATHIPNHEEWGDKATPHYQAYQSPTLPLKEWGWMQDYIIDSFTAKQHTSRIKGHGVTWLPRIIKHIRAPHFPWRSEVDCKTDSSTRSRPSNAHPELPGMESLGCLALSSISEPHTSLEEVGLNARRSHRTLPSTTHPESRGMGWQGFPTLASISEPHTSLEGVRLHARRSHRTLPSNTHPESPGYGWQGYPTLSSISEPHTSLEGVRLNARLTHQLVHCQATHIPNHQVWSYKASPLCQAYQAPHLPWRSEVECMTDSSTRSMPSNTQPESPGMESLGCLALSSISEPHTYLERVGLNARRIHRTLPSNTHPESRGMGWQGFPTLSSISEPHIYLEGVRLNARLTHRLVHCQATHIPNHQASCHLATPHYQAYQSPTLPLMEWGWTQGVIVHCQATHIPNHQVMGDKATPHYKAYQSPTLPLKEWGWMQDWIIDSFTAKQHTSRIKGHGVTWLPRIIKHIRAPHFPWRSEVDCKTDSSTRSRPSNAHPELPGMESLGCLALSSISEPHTSLEGVGLNARRSHRTLPSTTHPESRGMGWQGFPTLASISEPHTSLEGVRLHARRSHRTLPSNTHPESPGYGWQGYPTLSSISEPHTSLEGVRLNARLTHQLVHCQATHIPNHQVWSYKASPLCQAYQAPHLPWRSEVECMTDSSNRSMPSNTQAESPGMESLGCLALSSISEPHTYLERVGLNARRIHRTLPSNTHPESRGMGWQGFPTLSSISEPHIYLEGVRLNARLTHRLVHCQATHIPNHQASCHLATPHYQAYQSPTLPLMEWGWTQGVIVHCQATHIPNHQVMGDKATPHYKAYQSPTLPLKEWGWMQDWIIDSFTAKQHTSRIKGHGVTWLPRIIKHIRAPHFPWRSEVDCKTDSSTRSRPSNAHPELPGMESLGCLALSSISEPHTSLEGVGLNARRSHRTLPSTTHPESRGMGWQGFPTLASISEPHTSLEGVRLHARRSHRTLPSNTHPESPGYGWQGYPTLSSISEPHTSLEGVRLNARLTHQLVHCQATHIPNHQVWSYKASPLCQAYQAPHLPWRSEVECMTDSSTRSMPSNTQPESPGMESLGCLALSSISEPHTYLERVGLNARRIHRTLPSNTHPESRVMGWQGFPTLSSISEPHIYLEGVRLNARLTHRLVHCQATHIPNHQASCHLATPHYQAYQSPTLPLMEWGWTQGVIVHCQATHIPNHQVMGDKATPHYKAYQSPTLPLKEWGSMQDWIIDSFTAKQHTSRIAGHGVTWLPRIIKHIRAPHFPWRSEVECKTGSSTHSRPSNAHPELQSMESLGCLALSSISEPHTSLEGVGMNARRSHRTMPGNTHPESPGMESLDCPTLSSISEPHTSLEGVGLNARLTHRLVHCQATHNPNHRAWSHLAAPHYQAYQRPTLPMKEWGWTQGVIVHCQATHIPNHQVMGDKATPHYEAYQSPTLPLKEWGRMQDWLIDSFTAKQHTSRITGHGFTWLTHIIKHIRAPHFPWRSGVERKKESSYTAKQHTSQISR